MKIGYLEQSELQECHISTNRKKEGQKEGQKEREISHPAASFEILCSLRCSEASVLKSYTQTLLSGFFEQ